MALPPGDARSTRTPRAATSRSAPADPAPVNWRTAAALLIILLLAASAVAWFALHRATATKAPTRAATARRLTSNPTENPLTVSAISPTENISPTSTGPAPTYA